MLSLRKVASDDSTPCLYPWCIAWRVMEHLIVWLGNCLWSKQEVLVGFKFMLLFYKYTSTTSTYWIQTNSISVNLTYDMIFFECFVIGTLVIISTANGFYLPGLAPVNYCKESDEPKSCKVTWNYYRVDFWLLEEQGLFVTNKSWVRSCKMTVFIMKKITLTSSPLCVVHLLRSFLTVFKFVGFIQISSSICYRSVDSR
jgi:hypothetical protein